MNENIVLGFNFDYHLGKSSTYLINFEPRFDYYLNSAFNGFHIGSNLTYVISGIPESKTTLGPITVTVPASSAGQIALVGALVGYIHPLSDAIFFRCIFWRYLFVRWKSFCSKTYFYIRI